MALLSAEIAWSQSAEAQEESQERAVRSEAVERLTTSPLLIYRPPSRGVPRLRVGGGVKGLEVEAIVALAPDDHVGLTRHAQPTLYWHTPAPLYNPLFFTLNDARRIEPLVEVALPAISQGGIHAINLADYGVRLEPGVEYHWFISIVLDPLTPSRDLVVGAAIARTASGHHLQQFTGSAQALAQEGIWYDALAVLLQRSAEQPHEPRWRQQQRQLLDYIELAHLADSSLVAAPTASESANAEVEPDAKVVKSPLAPALQP